MKRVSTIPVSKWISRTAAASPNNFAAASCHRFACGVWETALRLLRPGGSNLSRFGALVGLRRAIRGEYARGIAVRAAAELYMQRLCFIATVVTIVSSTAGGALAQTAPAGGTAPAAGAAAAPAATAAPPADKPVATTAPADKPAAATTDKPADPKKEAAESKKKKTASKKMTRQQEIDKSIDSGTVPSRYRSQVPKQYHHLIPFDRQ